MKENESDRGEIIIYQTSKQEVELKVRLKHETVWLDAHQMAKLFNVDRTGVVHHIRNIYKGGELKSDSTCAKIAQVAKDGKVHKMDFYILDMIISIGYRVNSKHATQFRIWATNILKNYLAKGYAVNQNELLEEKEKFRDLQSAIHFLHEKVQRKQLKGQEKEILNLLASNKRTGSFLFIYYLDRNDYIYSKTGEKKIKDNALTALALLIAESDPKDKEILIKIIINLIAS